MLLVPLGGLDPVQAAAADRCWPHALPCGEAVLAPARARFDRVVIGVGGLGHKAVQLLEVLSPARVVAVDLDSVKLTLAESIGADHTVQAGDHAAEEIRRISGGFGCELVIDGVGAQP